MKPAAILDTAKVLYWAWSGDRPFYTMTDGDGIPVSEIYGFAICLLAGEIYRFHCNRAWRVQNDWTFPTLESAMSAMNEQEQPIHWNKFDDTDIAALLDGSQKIKFYREVGERRVIQKIIDHLKQNDCDGMWV